MSVNPIQSWITPESSLFQPISGGIIFPSTIISPNLTIQTNNALFVSPNGGTGVRILPSTNTINVQNLNFVSTLNAISTGGVGLAGAINMTELTSSIKGYNWATVLPAS
jgi:hypothetical protein